MTLQKAVEQYIALKRSLGCRFRSDGVILNAFSKATPRLFREEFACFLTVL